MSRISRFFFAVLFVVFATVPGVADELYVANFGTNTVSNIVTNGSKVNSIAMDGNPFDVVTTADGAYVYVSCPTANSVRVIRTADNFVVATIVTPSSPAKMAIGNNDTRLYVANNTLAAPHVTIVDITKNPDGTRANVVIGSIDLSVFGGNAYSVATSGGFLAIGTNAYTLLYDTTSTPPFLVASRYIGTLVNDLEFKDGGTLLYTALANRIETIDENGVATEQGNMHVLRVSSLAAKAVLGLGFNALNSMALRNQYLYVTSLGGELFSVDTTTDTPGPSLLLSGQIWGIAIGDRIYVSNQAVDAIDIIRVGRTPDRDRVDGSILLPAGAFSSGITILPPAPKGKKP